MSERRTQQEAKDQRTRSPRTEQPESQTEFQPDNHDLLELQRKIGNRGVQRLLAQRKLTVGEPDDAYEQEADRVAETVMRMPEPLEEEEKLQAKPDNIMREAMPTEEDELMRQEAPLEEEQALVQMDAVPGSVPAVDEETESQIEGARGGGQALPESAREFFEPRFGQDFSGVQVHTGSDSDMLNRDLSARAFTTGQDIFFRSGEYNPESSGGRELLAHELTHVVQQGGSTVQAKDDETVQRDIDFSEVGMNVLSGIASVPGDILGGLERTIEGYNFGDDTRQIDIAGQNERALGVITGLVTNINPIRQAIEVVTENYISKLPAEAQQAVYDQVEQLGADAAGFITGRVIGSQIASRIASAIATEIVASALYQQIVTKLGVSAATGATGIGIPITLLIMQGVLQRAGEASDRLKVDYPDIYWELRSRDLDMVWFLVEPHIEKIRQQVEEELGTTTGSLDEVGEEGEVQPIAEQSMDGERASNSEEPTIPDELLMSVDYTQMNEQSLRERYMLIQQTLLQFKQSTPDTALLQEEADRLQNELIDRVNQRSIQLDLEAFNNIQIQIPASPTAAGETADGRSITVRAAYFINTDTAQEHYKDERKDAGFNQIQKALSSEGDKALIQTGKGKALSSGAAVEYGKAGPHDIQIFIEEAVRNGTMHKFAVSQGAIKAQQELSALDNDALTNVIQEWVYTTGVGVDCSGFVLQSLIRAREAVRNELRSLGVPEDQLPKEIDHKVRNAQSFEKEAKVEKPADLRPGDAWVCNNGKHIRIVMNVRQITSKDGKPAIEFDTAESAGGSTESRKGQIQKTWKSKNLDSFNGLKGSFHRM